MAPNSSAAKGYIIIENVIIVVIDSTGRKAILVLILGGGVEIPPTFVPSGGGEIS